MEMMGIDVGGSGIKGALVNINTGELNTPRYRLPTPELAKPNDISEAVYLVAKHFEWRGPIGVGFPSVVINGVIKTAANVDSSWIGKNAEKLFGVRTGAPVYVLNDADAAGIAEMSFGAGMNHKGVVIMITLGTGIGTAIFSDGIIVRNTEFGHLKIRGKDAELRASDAVRKNKELSWKKWSKRLSEYLSALEDLFWPDLFIIGGGVSKESEKFFPFLKLRTKVVPAVMFNQAGIVGAAIFAARKHQVG